MGFSGFLLSKMGGAERGYSIPKNDPASGMGVPHRFQWTPVLAQRVCAEGNTSLPETTSEVKLGPRWFQWIPVVPQMGCAERDTWVRKTTQHVQCRFLLISMDPGGHPGRCAAWYPVVPKTEAAREMGIPLACI